MAAVVVVHQNLTGRFDRARDDVPGVHRQVDTGRLHVDVGHTAVGQDDDVVIRTVEFPGFDVVVEADLDAESLAFVKAPVDDPDQVAPPW